MLLFFVYCLLLCYLAARIPFVRRTGIPPVFLVLLFLAKVVAAIAYGYILGKDPYYRSISDTWMYYQESLVETDILLENPRAFFAGIIKSFSTSPGDNLFAGSKSQWNNAKTDFFIRILAIINLATGKAYYTGALFFAFISFLGSSALYRLLKPFTRERIYVLLCCCYLLPSTLFWCSGNHKDTLICSLTFVIMYSALRLLKADKGLLIHWLVIIVAAPVLFVLRNYTLLFALPVILVWALRYRFHLRPGILFKGTVTGLIVVLLVMPLLPSRYNPLNVIVQKQNEFLRLEGRSVLPTTRLQPTLSSFFRSLPRAANYGFFKPFIGDIRGILFVPSFIEVVALICLLIFLALKGSFTFLYNEPVLWSLLFFCIGLILLSGYTVHFISPLTRYRSIPLPIFFGTLNCLIQTTNIKKY